MTESGLCGRCAHARTVANRRGSTFLLCRLARVDSRFPRYPLLPVLACAGFEELGSDGGGSGAGSEDGGAGGGGRGGGRERWPGRATRA